MTRALGEETGHFPRYCADVVELVLDLLMFVELSDNRLVQSACRSRSGCPTADVTVLYESQ